MRKSREQWAETKEIRTCEKKKIRRLLDHLQISELREAK